MSTENGKKILSVGRNKSNRSDETRSSRAAQIPSIMRPKIPEKSSLMHIWCKADI